MGKKAIHRPAAQQFGAARYSTR